MDFQSVNTDQAIDRLIASLECEKPILVATPNVNHVMRSRRDPKYLSLLRQFDFLFADGMPIVWVSALMSQALPGRVTGADLLPQISQRLAGSDMSIFLAGTESEKELSLASRTLERMFPGLKVSTFFPRYGFDKSEVETNNLIAAIHECAPSFIFLGVGSPKQEEWLVNNVSRLPKGVYIGCGMAIGFITGEVRRAPKLLQRLGLEWVWRIYQEPRRLFTRYLYDMGFIFVGIREASIYHGRRMKKALKS